MHLLSFVCLFDSQAFVILSTFILFAYEHVRLGTKSLGFEMGRSHLSLRFQEISAQLASHQTSMEVNELRALNRIDRVTPLRDTADSIPALLIFALLVLSANCLKNVPTVISSDVVVWWI